MVGSAVLKPWRFMQRKLIDVWALVTLSKILTGSQACTGIFV